MEKVQFIGKS